MLSLFIAHGLSVQYPSINRNERVGKKAPKASTDLSGPKSHSCPADAAFSMPWDRLVVL